MRQQMRMLHIASWGVLLMALSVCHALTPLDDAIKVGDRMGDVKKVLATYGIKEYSAYLYLEPGPKTLPDDPNKWPTPPPPAPAPAPAAPPIPGFPVPPTMGLEGDGPFTTVMVTENGKVETPLSIGSPVLAPGETPKSDLELWAALVFTPIPYPRDGECEEYIYRVNNTYYFSLLVWGHGDNAVVTDLVACSIEPMMKKWNTAIKDYSPVALKPEDLKRSAQGSAKPLFLCTTKKGITLGSTFGDIIWSYGWPDYFLPFAPASQTAAAPTPEAAATPSTSSPAPLPAPSTPPQAMDQSPIQLVTYSPGSTTFGDYPLPLGRSGAGEFLRRFTDGTTEKIDAGFTRNCFLSFEDKDDPRESVTMTLIDYSVVRIHKGVRAKDPPLRPLAIGGPNPAMPIIDKMTGVGEFTVNIAPIPKDPPVWKIDNHVTEPNDYYPGTATFKLRKGVHSIEAESPGYMHSNTLWVVVVPPPPPPPEPAAGAAQPVLPIAGPLPGAGGAGGGGGAVPLQPQPGVPDNGAGGGGGVVAPPPDVILPPP